MQTMCIFAHPDDESYGPAGTITELAGQGRVDLVCVTDGASGQRFVPKKADESLAEIRKKELRQACDLLGVEGVHFLDYPDGRLCLNNYHSIAEKVKSILEELKPQRIITYDLGGVSGHPDHMVVSSVSSYLFKRLDYLQEIWYYCLSHEAREILENYGYKNYFVFSPQGFANHDIDKVVDISNFFDTKMEAIGKHRSQVKNISSTVKIFEKLNKEECFRINKK
jgi:N-acetylglucosamine malate deacetylase 2